MGWAEVQTGRGLRAWEFVQNRKKKPALVKMIRTSAGSTDILKPGNGMLLSPRGSTGRKMMRRAAPMTAAQRDSRRRLLALLGTLLYTLAAIALPSLHLGLHRNDHTHQGGGLQRLRDVQAAYPHPHLGPHAHSHALLAHDEPEPLGESSDPPATALPRVQLQAAGSLASAPQPPPQRSAFAGWVGLLAATARHATLGGPEHSGSSAPDPAHAAGSQVHFASAFLSGPALPVVPAASLLPESSAYPAFSDRSPPRALVVTKDARGPPPPAAV